MLTENAMLRWHVINKKKTLIITASYIYKIATNSSMINAIHVRPNSKYFKIRFSMHTDQSNASLKNPLSAHDNKPRST
jgi:hypothetical protein